MKTSFAAVAALCAAVLSASGAGAATADVWTRDLDAITRAILSTHPRPFGLTGRAAFTRAAERLRTDLPSLTEPQRVAGVMRLVALLGDNRTRIEPASPQFSRWYPVRIYHFEDGYYVTAAHLSTAELAGARILEIAGTPVEEVAERARALLPAANDAASREGLYALHNAALMEALGLTDGQGRMAMRLQLQNGRRVTRLLSARPADDSSFEWTVRSETFGIPLSAPPNQWVSAFRGLGAQEFLAADGARPPHLAFRGSFFSQGLPVNNGFYIQVNRFGDTTAASFATFIDRAFAEIDRTRPARLIVDLRYAYGGDGSKVIHLLRAIAARLPDPPWRDIYIITGRRTAGAAIAAVDGIGDLTAVTIVGEPTGMGRSNFGDARSIPFPDTGLMLSISTRSYQLGLSDDHADAIAVDWPALMSFEDYRSGRDPALAAILGDDDIRAFSIIASSQGAAAARQAYQARLARFRVVAWWRPPGFEEIKAAGYARLAAGQPDEAIGIFTLLTEAAADHWNSWESLGRAQSAAGRLAEARRSYRCALALDPENFDSGDLRRALAVAPAEPADLPAGCPAQSGARS